MVFSAEAKFTDSETKSDFINRLRVKSIYPAVFGDTVKVTLYDAEVHQAKYVISVYELMPNPGGNSLSFSMRS